MGPVSFTYSARVPAAIDKVFALIADPLRMPEWLPRCVAVKATTSDRVGKGARYKVTFQRDTHRHEAVIEIIDFAAAHVWLGRDLPSCRVQNILWSRLGGRVYQGLPEAHLAANGLSVVAQRPVLPAAECPPDVRRADQQSEKSVDAIKHVRRTSCVGPSSEPPPYDARRTAFAIRTRRSRHPATRRRAASCRIRSGRTCRRSRGLPPARRSDQSDTRFRRRNCPRTSSRCCRSPADAR